MSAFGSPPPETSEAMSVLIDSRPQMGSEILTNLERKYAGGSLITFKAHTSQSPKETFLVYARVVKELDDRLLVVICNEENKFCTEFTNVIKGIALPKGNVVCLKRNMFADETYAACAAGGAKKKSRRHKQRKPSKTKRKTRRAKRTRKRRA
jgi:hypothetical protein